MANNKTPNTDALAALDAISTHIKPESTKSAEKAAAVEANRVARLEVKMKLLSTGKRIDKEGGEHAVSQRALLQHCVKAFRLGITLEQLKETTVGSRFDWSPVGEHVIAYCRAEANDECAKLIADAFGLTFKQASEPKAKEGAKGKGKPKRTKRSASDKVAA